MGNDKIFYVIKHYLNIFLKLIFFDTVFVYFMLFTSPVNSNVPFDIFIFWTDRFEPFIIIEQLSKCAITQPGSVDLIFFIPVSERSVRFFNIKFMLLNIIL